MTTPSHYSRANLKQILGENKYFLYHWTSIESAKSILNDGFIYSKAMLFGLNFHDNLQLLSNLKRNDLLTETKNGFINYVFLGNTNWLEYNSKSFYGDICFVIKPEAILLTREFFVFPFNTGREFDYHSDEEKTCDTRTLMDALNRIHPCYEILVRRRIRIDNQTIDKIICTDEHCAIIKSNLEQNTSMIPVESSNGVQTMKENENIELIDPLDKERKPHKYSQNEYIRYEDHIYIRTKFSNCILRLKINSSNELIDINTNSPVGRIVCKHDKDFFRGPKLEP